MGFLSSSDRSRFLGRGAAWAPLPNALASYGDNGSNPAVWSDSSGNGRFLTQIVGASQPAIIPGELNGRQIRRWDGVDDFLERSAAFLEGLIGLTIYAVFRTSGPQPVAGFGVVCSAGNPNDFTNDVILSTSGVANDSVLWQVNNGSDGGPTTDAIADAWQVVAGVFNGGASLSVFNATSGTAASSIAAPATTPASLGLFWVGRYSSSFDLKLAGDIAELIIYPAAHNATQRSYMLTGLAAKYNLPLA